MTFMVLGFNYPAPEGPERRKACRQEHLQLGEKLYRDGKWRYAAGILNEVGELVGSVIICEFSSCQELEGDWLSQEPYLINKVWEKVEIHPIRPAPFI